MRGLVDHTSTLTGNSQSNALRSLAGGFVRLRNAKPRL